jgi:hypothetical protein
MRREKKDEITRFQGFLLERKQVKNAMFVQ